MKREMRTIPASLIRVVRPSPVPARNNPNAERLPGHSNFTETQLHTMLVESIRKNGYRMGSVGILDVEDCGDHYEILDGKRRFLAGTQCGVTEFPCVVYSEMTEMERLMTRIAE